MFSKPTNYLEFNPQHKSRLSVLSSSCFEQEHTKRQSMSCALLLSCDDIDGVTINLYQK